MEEVPTFLYENEASGLEQTAFVTMATRVLRPLKRAFCAFCAKVDSYIQQTAQTQHQEVVRDHQWVGNHLCRQCLPLCLPLHCTIPIQLLSSQPA